MESKDRRPEMLREIYVVPEEYNLPISRWSSMWSTSGLLPTLQRRDSNELPSRLRDASRCKLQALINGTEKEDLHEFAVASCCQLLLMDEPTNGLDIPSKALFRKVIAGNLPADSSLIISTHQVHDVEQLLDHVFILNNSEMIIMHR